MGKTITMDDEQWAWFRESLDEMRAIYSQPDDGHTEYFDADDIARDVAEALDELMDGVRENA